MLRYYSVEVGLGAHTRGAVEGADKSARVARNGAVRMKGYVRVARGRAEEFVPIRNVIVISAQALAKFGGTVACPVVDTHDVEVGLGVEVGLKCDMRCSKQVLSKRPVILECQSGQQGVTTATHNLPGISAANCNLRCRRSQCSR